MIQFGVAELKAIKASLTGSRVFRPKPGAWTGQQQLELIDKVSAEINRIQAPQLEGSLEQRLVKLRADLDKSSPGWRERFAELLAEKEAPNENVSG